VAPKLVPVIVIEVPTTPEEGFRLVIFGPATPTLKVTPLLATPPTVTMTFPVVAPVGTGTTMLVALQLVGAVEVPLNVTVLAPCVAPKLEPAMVIAVPGVPDVGLRLEILGAVGGGSVEPWPRPEHPEVRKAMKMRRCRRTTLAFSLTAACLSLRNSLTVLPRSKD
jgi:hypothetical protein